MNTAIFEGTYGPRHIFIDDEALCGTQGGLITGGEIIDWAIELCNRCIQEYAVRRKQEQAA